MSALTEHAERELRLAGLFDEDSDYDGKIGKAVLSLVQCFAAQNHSGNSAALAIRAFKAVANFEVLTPLTGKDDEWERIPIMSKGGAFFPEPPLLFCSQAA